MSAWTLYKYRNTDTTIPLKESTKIVGIIWERFQTYAEGLGFLNHKTFIIEKYSLNHSNFHISPQPSQDIWKIPK